jgi:cytochrome c peroxidase
MPPSATHAGSRRAHARALSQIVAFETRLYTAQASDQHAGDLNVRGAIGGAKNLTTQNFYVGINDSLGGEPSGDSFSVHVFSDYDTWMNLSGYRQSIARGEDLFNNLPIPITDVGGLNAALGQQVIMGTFGNPTYLRATLPLIG